MLGADTHAHVRAPARPGPLGGERLLSVDPAGRCRRRQPAAQRQPEDAAADAGAVRTAAGGAASPTAHTRPFRIRRLGRGPAGRTQRLHIAGSDPDVPYDSSYLGEAMIVDAAGQVLARRELDEGAGVVIVDVVIPATAHPLDSIPPRCWIPE